MPLLALVSKPAPAVGSKEAVPSDATVTAILVIAAFAVLEIKAKKEIKASVMWKKLAFIFFDDLEPVFNNI
jgi:hypothetical protein